MVGRALIWSLGTMLIASNALAEKPVAAATDVRVPEIVDPYAEPEPRIVDVIDPYATTAVSSDQDLERVCRNYCLARRDAMPAPAPRLPPLRQSEEWGSASEPEKRRGLELDEQTVGGIILGASALVGSALLLAEADSGSNYVSLGGAVAAAGAGVGLVVGLVLVIDGHDGKPELQMASR